jgi:predicted GNAT superfamily acetyltransferase
MLAVDQASRDRGVGRRLKEYQRERLRAMGVHRMYWTFDPLVARNAHLNLNLLGARVVEYARDMYGENPMSRTDSVIGTDRFVVEWTIGGPADRRSGGARAAGSHAPPITSASDPLPDSPSVLVAIPPDIQALKNADPDAALRWRRSTRRAFEHYLSRGYAVTGLVPAPSGGGSCYVLEHPA